MNYYFMMGDNRDNSADGRFWGMVPEDHIVGKPLFVFLSIEQKGAIKVSLLNRIRFKRFFKPIHGDAIENKNLF
jgi:signal peptidase I